GRERAARLIEWLAPLAAELGRPLRAEALHSRTALMLARSTALAQIEPQSMRRFGLVPLERLAVPPELSGRHGVFRTHGPNVFGADDDLDAIRKWLQRHAMSPRTHEAYGREVERFYLWCLREARKPLSSLVEADLHAYRAFLAQPSAHWVQPRQADRASEDWRPFRGPLSPLSQRRALTVISSMLGALVDGGYLSANAARGVTPHLKLPRAGIDIRRSFTEAQWSWILATLAGQPDTAFTRRTRLVLELGATSGLRLIELATARMGALRQEPIDGRLVWMLDVLGKGNRRRRVPILDDIKAMIDRHQQDMEAAAIGYDPAAPRLRQLLSASGDEG
ncbi:tyrosine-type recombinase/integrase, partial [Caldimonas tepidiphila]|uniref:tyrosine-type recombinase/integrase n=1 Tax=Caldimonas tepidiphila TaxID=2315841 RepID=UPI003AF39238